jgi:hypothetical protein
MMSTTEPRTDYDPVSLEIMWSRLISIADEMWTTVLRTAVSTIIGAAQDFGCELLDEHGNSLAHSYRSMPVFNLVMPETTRQMLAIFPPETLRPGDILTTNDPWMCAGHLDDIAIITPIFRAGRIVAFANTIAHTSSIGGALDGLSVRDLHEDGLFIPPLKLYEAGRPNETAFAFIRNNVRQPEMVLTDIESQVTANELATQRVLAFMDEYRLDSLTVPCRNGHAVRDRGDPRWPLRGRGVDGGRRWPDSAPGGHHRQRLVAARRLRRLGAADDRRWHLVRADLHSRPHRLPAQVDPDATDPQQRGLLPADHDRGS